MYENYLTAALAIYAIDRLVNWYHLYALRALADEAMFPADDPIMTSSIEAFEYEDEEEEAVPPNWEYDAPEPEEPPVATPAFDLGGPVVDAVRRAEEENEQFHLMLSEIEEVEVEQKVTDESRCLGLNKSGQQCGQKPKSGEKYCYLHKE